MVLRIMRSLIYKAGIVNDVLIVSQGGETVSPYVTKGGYSQHIPTSICDFELPKKFVRSYRISPSTETI
jgi:hypothetical protein